MEEGGYNLITSVSRVMMEQGPRLIQQDVALVDALLGKPPRVRALIEP